MSDWEGMSVRLVPARIARAAAFLAALATVAAANSAHAAGAGAPHLDGANLGMWWVVPFAGILLSIAIFPLLAPRFWHHHFGKVSAFWALSFLLPFWASFGFELTLYELLHTLLLEYISFIILLLSLFTVAGGVRVRGSIPGTPLVNTGFLALGTIIASWMGTTGAAMLLVRPIIRANLWRRHNVHVMVFFIFLVANIGGALTPLGDPPLFLGFLKGVDFFWPTVHLFVPMAFTAGILLALFFVVDTLLYRREKQVPPATDETGAAGAKEKLGLDGKLNLLLLGGVVLAVLMSGVWDPGVTFDVYHVQVELQNLVRDVLLLAIAGLSWWLTSHENRQANAFTWFPIVEVAKLFAGIFITIIPAIAILRAGEEGALAPVITAVSDNGNPVNYMYFWATGVLSSFLDNAPTYLVFFNTAGGDAQALMTTYAETLLAISAGAVFMGANTYIGNAPNFMVRSIAEERGIKMPSFFGYMIWSVVILVPVFILNTFLFFL